MKTKAEKNLFGRIALTSGFRLRLILVIVFFLLGACKNTGTMTQQTPSPVPTSGAGDAQAPRPVASYADVVSQVAPAVVTIRSERRARAPQQYPFQNDPFFRHYFGPSTPNAPQRPPESRETGLGSGVVVSADGYLVTNHHVIDGVEDIRATARGVNGQGRNGADSD